MNSAQALCINDLQIVFGEPRIQDLRVAERLGFERPRVIRELIDRNREGLETYSSLAVRHGKSRGQEFTEYSLNEPQALLICMFSKTDRAAAVRREVIDVYMAYRRGQEAPPPADPWERMTRRQAVVRQAVAFHVETRAPDFAETLAHLLTVGRRNRRLPAFWSDIEVRQALINMHRQLALDEAKAALLDRYGPDRTPGRSSIGRFWQRLDAARDVEASPIHLATQD